MNQNITRLTTITQKPTRLILGLMSGTSLDGLDIALCRFEGNGLATKVEVLNFTTYPYSDSLRYKLREVFSKDVVKLANICLMNSRLANVHARMILATLEHWQVSPNEIDAIASHGQTIYHAPKRLHLKPNFTNSTLQIGDGDHLAYRTGILTVSDFRQKHVAAGGEGAPLAVYGDYLLFSSPTEHRVLLNLGGIANFTYLPASRNPMEVFATDTGPANALTDAVVRTYLPPMLYDENGEIAEQGTVNEALLETLKKHPFFLQSLPRSTGSELFNLHFVQDAQRNSDTLGIDNKDLLATLVRFSAETIADALSETLGHVGTLDIYISGGGAKNATLLAQIQALMSQHRFHPFKNLGISADAKEAVLFALLANETLTGEGIALGAGEYAMPPLAFGKISFPL